MKLLDSGQLGVTVCASKGITYDVSSIKYYISIRLCVHYFESESRRDKPSNFSTDVDGDLWGRAPLLDARSLAGELPAVDALGGGQTPEGPLRDQDPPEPSTGVLEVHSQVGEGCEGQECEGGLVTQLHPLVFPAETKIRIVVYGL